VIDTARFWKHVMDLDDGRDTCWVWIGAMRDDGTGRFFVTRRREIPAHHAAYEIRTDHPVPKGYQLTQTCNHPNCVRHWKLDRPHRKLSERERECIRRSRLPSSQLSRMHGVSLWYIWHLRTRKSHAVLA
jgi:hypothetical protein